MPGRVIEVLSFGTHLSKDRGFMKISPSEGEVSKIPIADLAAVIAGKGVSFSANLVLALHETGASLVITGSTYHPAAFFWPQSEHTSHVQRLREQIAASEPLKKRLWQQVVQYKIVNQGEVLRTHTEDDKGLSVFAKRVRSGDPDNLEAQAARRYWQALMGIDFRRNTGPSGEDVSNIFLNYGYAILRAAMARAISSCGLVPALGIHHKNLSNPFCLVDDLMEPYRPLVDNLVAEWLKNEPPAEINVNAKRQLAGLLDVDLKNFQGENSPVSVTMLQVARSFCAALEKGKGTLEYPLSILGKFRTD